MCKVAVAVASSRSTSDATSGAVVGCSTRALRPSPSGTSSSQWRPGPPSVDDDVAHSHAALDNDAESVRELMQRAVALAPASARCWNLLGDALTQLRDDGAALPALVRATELGADDAWYNRACVHMRHGQVDAAIAALRTAVASAPELRADALDDEDFAALLDHPEFVALVAS